MMKRIPVLIALASLAVLIAAAPVQAARPRLAGGWTGNDPAPPDGDGSTLFLTVSGGRTAHITFIDTFGTSVKTPVPGPLSSSAGSGVKSAAM